MILGILITSNTLLILLFINIKLNTMAKTQKEVAAELVAVKEQVVKFKAEVVGKLAALADAIANLGLADPDVEAALADLKTTVQSADDLIEDAPVADPPTEG